MRTSAEIGALAGALAIARGEMEQPACNRRNANFGKGYADLSAVQEAAVPALAKHGLAILQAVDSVSGETVTISTTLVHESGQWMTPDPVTVPVEIPLSNAGKQIRTREQQIGALTTYLRRYALAALLNLASEEDADGNAPEGATVPGLAPGVIRAPGAALGA